MQPLIRAVALVGAYNITVIDVPKPTIVNATDAIVRITASVICGSDLHNNHTNLGSPEPPSGESGMRPLAVLRKSATLLRP